MHRLNMRLVKNAITVSGLINACMLLAAFSPDKHPLLARFSDIIAAPPGFFINVAFVPKQHTREGFIRSAAESLAFSLFFYAVIAWLVLEVGASIRLRVRSSR